VLGWQLLRYETEIINASGLAKLDGRTHNDGYREPVPSQLPTPVALVKPTRNKFSQPVEVRLFQTMSNSADITRPIRNVPYEAPLETVKSEVDRQMSSLGELDSFT